MFAATRDGVAYRKEGGFWVRGSALLVILVGFVTGPAVLLGQLTSGDLNAADGRANSTYPAFCTESQLIDFAALAPQARAALARCRDPADEHERAACTVLQGMDLLANENRAAGNEELHEALAMYHRLGDSWGVWLVHTLLGASIGIEDGRQLAEFHFRRALRSLRALGDSQGPMPARSRRLFGEILGVPEVVLRMWDVRPGSMSESLAEFAETTTSYLLGVDLGCRQQPEEAAEPVRRALAIVRSNPSIFDESLLNRYLGWLQLQQGGRAGSLQDVARPAQLHPSPGGLIADHLHDSMYREFCEEPQLLEFGSPISAQARAALARCGISADEDERAACALLRGLELRANHEIEAALESLDMALDMYVGSRDSWGAWIVHFLKASYAEAEGDRQQVESHLLTVLEYLDPLETSKLPVIPVRSLRLMGEIGDASDALLNAIDAMPAHLAPSMVQDAVIDINYLLGQLLGCQKRFEDADRHFRQVSARSSLRLLDEGRLHGLAGLINQQRDKLESSLISLQKSLKIASSQRDVEQVLWVSERLSQISNSANRLEEALRVNRKALEIVGSDPSMQALLLVERGILYARGGDIPTARSALAAAQAVAEVVDIALLEEQVLLITGMRLADLEFLEDAASSLKKVVQRLCCQTVGEGESWILETAHFYLAGIYNTLGRDDLFAAEVQELRGLVDNSGRQELLQLVELVIAGDAFSKALAESGGVSEKAIEDLLSAWRQAVEGLENSKNISLRKISREFEAMQTILGRALQAEDAAGFWGAFLDQNSASTAIGRGLAQAAPAFEHMQHGRQEEAMRAYADFFQRFLTSSRPSPLKEAKMLMGLALASDDKLDTGLNHCRKSIEIFESLANKMHVNELVAGLIDEEGHQLYQSAVEILARASPEEAFSYAERGRAWTLRRSLAPVRRDVRDRSSAEQEVLVKLAALERNWRAGSSKERPRIRGLESLREEFMGLRLQLILTAERESDPDPAEPLSPDQLRREVLGSDSTLLSYYPGTEKIWVWAVDRRGIEMTSIPMPPADRWKPRPEERWKDLTCQIQALRWAGSPAEARLAAEARGARLLTGCDDEDDPTAALYRRLIAPIAPHLQHRHLIVMPHGILHHLPFAALRNPETGRYLAQDFTLSVTPSASSLELLSRRLPSDAGDALVLGNPKTPLPPLAGAQEEARSVAALLGGTLFLEDQATESRIYEKAGQIRLLHLAAHGQYVPRNPYFSRLLLSADSQHDGALEMHEVLDRLDLRGAELVVLSGCETALGEITRGDEIIGLTRAFLVAGSQTVISTLWPVDDAASERLMTAFYQRFLKGGDTAAEALRAAQLEMLAHESSSAPYFWAGFTLTGDPHNRWRPPPEEGEAKSRP